MSPAEVSVMAGTFFSMLVSSDAALATLQITEDATSVLTNDNRGTLLLLVALTIGWVLYNILQPVLNQMRMMLKCHLPGLLGRYARPHPQRRPLPPQAALLRPGHGHHRRRNTRLSRRARRRVRCHRP
jgi:hypothetical protein